MKKRVLSWLILLPLMTWFAADVKTVVAQEELIVSAAASLTNAFTDIGKEFENANPGI